jgi:hypothetical protein
MAVCAPNAAVDTSYKPRQNIQTQGCGFCHIRSTNDVIIKNEKKSGDIECANMQVTYDNIMSTSNAIYVRQPTSKIATACQFDKPCRACVSLDVSNIRQTISNMAPT